VIQVQSRGEHLFRPSQAVTKAFLCEQIRQPRLVKLVNGQPFKRGTFADTRGRLALLIERFLTISDEVERKS
jgi:hypothetical protein